MVIIATGILVTSLAEREFSLFRIEYPPYRYFQSKGRRSVTLVGPSRRAPKKHGNICWLIVSKWSRTEDNPGDREILLSPLPRTGVRNLIP
jgi:hypothetical protein